MGERDTRSLLTDEMEAAVGSEVRRVVSFPVTANDIGRWAIAVYWPETPPRLFWDEAYAATTHHGAIVAPEDFNPFAWATAEPDLAAGTYIWRPWPETDLGLPYPPSRALILSELGVSFTPVRIRPGDVVTAVTTLVSYAEREGRLGLLLSTTLEERWTNQAGELLRTSSSVLVRYR